MIDWEWVLPVAVVAFIIGRACEAADNTVKNDGVDSRNSVG